MTDATIPGTAALAETQIAIAGMTCEACVRRVDRALRALPGVQHVRIDLARGDATIAHEPRLGVEAELVAAVVRAGYAPELREGAVS